MTRLEIINSALVKLGQTPLTDVTKSKAGRRCDEQYPASVRATLEAYPWDDFKQEAMLTAVEPAVPKFGFANSFVLPTDFVRLMQDDEENYSLSRGKIYNDRTELTIVYVAMPPDIEVIDATTQFGQALALHIAANVTYNISGDAAQVGMYEQQFRNALIKTTTNQTLQQPAKTIGTTTWLESRI